MNSDIAGFVWDQKYRWREGGLPREAAVSATFGRVARALASVERDPALWSERFGAALESFRFLPGGRILAGAGLDRRVTLLNCFVMDIPEDSLPAIFEALKEGALTMQQGGGVGYDFSVLRPRGTLARGIGAAASGPVSFMQVWDSMCGTILAAGARRGAMMGVLSCDHPDIVEFVEAKRDPAKLRHFNLSVLTSDAFMGAVRGDLDWPLVFPDAGNSPDAEYVRTSPAGVGEPVRCRVYRRIRARELWERIMRATYDVAEPGVIFVDRVNRENNLHYCERITCTNPCGEVPLPAYGACDLGSVNLSRFVNEPFQESAALDFDGIACTVAVAVRMLDNVYDVSRFPLEKQANTARRSRRLGIGITGLADALIMLGVRYGEDASFSIVERTMRTIRDAAYRASVEIAREKGTFPAFERDPYLAGEFIRRLPADLRDDIARDGIRNSHLVSIAPAGTISLFAGNVSSGLEPVYRFEHSRRVRTAEGGYAEHSVVDFAYRLWRESGSGGPLPRAFVTAEEIVPEAHLRMQAAIQAYVDNAISKTINVPSDISFDAFRAVYESAFDAGLKGCTTFRPNPVTGQVLLPAAGPGAPCCGVGHLVP